MLIAKGEKRIQAERMKFESVSLKVVQRQIGRWESAFECLYYPNPGRREQFSFNYFHAKLMIAYYFGKRDFVIFKTSSRGENCLSFGLKLTDSCSFQVLTRLFIPTRNKPILDNGFSLTFYTGAERPI